MKKNNNLSHLRCFPYAWQGLVHTFKTQKNMRLHSVAACAAIGISWYFNISKAEWLWVLMSLFFVMTTETINTAIEATVDL